MRTRPSRAAPFERYLIANCMFDHLRRTVTHTNLTHKGAASRSGPENAARSEAQCTPGGSIDLSLAWRQPEIGMGPDARWNRMLRKYFRMHDIPTVSRVNSTSLAFLSALAMSPQPRVMKAVLKAVQQLAVVGQGRIRSLPALAVLLLLFLLLIVIIAII